METRRSQQQSGGFPAVLPPDPAMSRVEQAGLGSREQGGSAREQQLGTFSAGQMQDFKSGLSQLLQSNGYSPHFQSSLPSSPGEIYTPHSIPSTHTPTGYFDAYDNAQDVEPWTTGNGYLPLDFSSLAPMSPGIFGSLPNQSSTSLTMPLTIQSNDCNSRESVFTSDWPSSLESLTFSTGSPSSISSDQTSFLPCDSLHQPGFKQYLNQDDLLSLSPHQSQHITISKAHEEPRDRASFSESPAFPSLKQEDFWAESEAIFQTADQELEPFFGLAGLAMGSEPSCPMPLEDPLSLEEADEMPVMEHEEKPAPAEAPLASSYKTNSAKSKQLGTFPADDAFATSLAQLSSSSSNGKPPYLWWTLSRSPIPQEKFQSSAIPPPVRAAILGSPASKLQMETLCAEIMEKFPYFGTAKEAKNWKSSIRSVIHTKPCFYKSEDKNKNVWWHVDLNIDPREQRRGMKKRNSVGDAKRPTNLGSNNRRGSTASTVGTYSTEGEEDAEAETDDEAENCKMQLDVQASHPRSRKRRKTN